MVTPPYETYRQNQGENEYLELRIVFDNCPESPRKWSNLGTIIQWSKYNFGDINPGEPVDIDEIESDIEDGKIFVVLPLFMYDHHTVTLSTANFYGRLPQGHARFDSAQIGYIYVTEEKLKKEGMTDKEYYTEAKIKQFLKNEIRDMNRYLHGEVYGYEVYHVEICDCCDQKISEQIDSCYGFFMEPGELAKEIQSTYDNNPWEVV